MDYAEEIYYSLLGELISPVPGVPNAFAEGAVCELWYREMWDAYERLRDRLGIEEEDEDVETIINALLSIQRTLCMEMFRLGEAYERRRLRN